MRSRSAVLTFFTTLGVFLAVGGALLLFLQPGSTAAEIARTPRPAPSAVVAGRGTPEPDATPEPEIAAAAAQSGPPEYVLVSNTPAIPRPDLPGRIVIPSIALDARVVQVGIVVEGGKPVWDTAAFAVGYHQGTALPGAIGNSVLAGHISSPVSKKGDVFKRLPEVRIGDRVDVYVGERRVSYEIAEVKLVPPTAVQVMEPTADATLTLITCYPDRVYNKRLIVVGKLIG